ncbi:hypothetical protein EDD29_0050 [Actinocorallia herbida]|uniref:Uncharacterized protein n=1 Tax=Actinocorallia herbida TaxID=58109 RepID=A0A3N1CMN5_9ACTN|nr:hypothetical protein [Actinocorallia herbida]ROO82570.1 hypothetical protein EDD29_0050 [Actinocorallia herbida]
MSTQNAPRDERTSIREMLEVQRRIMALENTPKVGPVTTSALNGTGNGAIAGDFEVGGFLAATAIAVDGDVAADALTADSLAATLITVGGQDLTGADIALLLNPPYGLGVKGATQVVTDQTATAVMAFTAPANGIYQLSGAVPWSNDNVGRREANWRVNGTTYQGSSIHVSSNTLVINSLALAVAMNAGQVAEIVVWQNSGGALNVLASTRMEALWRRPL